MVDLSLAIVSAKVRNGSAAALSCVWLFAAWEHIGRSELRTIYDEKRCFSLISDNHLVDFQLLA